MLGQLGTIQSSAVSDINSHNVTSLTIENSHSQDNSQGNSLSSVVQELNNMKIFKKRGRPIKF